MAEAEETTGAEEKEAKRPATQEYIVVTRIGGSGDPEVWMPGARIALDDDLARLHLAAGNVRALDDTDLPPEVDANATQTVHTAQEKTAKSSGKRKA